MTVNPRNAALSLALLTSAAALSWPAAAFAQDEENEWSIAPRGRLQIDVGDLSANDAVTSAAGGLAADAIVRRFFLGFDAKMPGNLSLRVEADLAPEFEDADWVWTDVYLAWAASDKLTLTLGHHKPAWGLEEQTSDLFPSFMERAALHTAFGNERRTGLGAAYAGKDFVLQAGAYLDDLDAILDDVDQGHSFFGQIGRAHV